MAATYYFHPFWTMTGAERDANMVNALKNLSLIGGLLILFVLGPWRPVVVSPYDEAATPVAIRRSMSCQNLQPA